MTAPTALRLWRLVVAGLLVIAGGQPLTAQTNGQGPWIGPYLAFRSYYLSQDRSRVPALLSELDRIGRNAPNTRPPIVGFMAGLLASADWDLLPENASLQLRRDLVLATALAGRPQRAETLGRSLGLPEKQVSQLRTLPPLSSLTVENATELDFLWGASFATGDARYVRPIVKRYIGLANRQDISSDIVAVADYMRSRQGDIRHLKDTHDRRTLQDIILGATILVSVARNSTEHEFVKKVMKADMPSSSRAAQALIAYEPGKR